MMREATVSIGAFELDSGAQLPAVEQRVTIYGTPRDDGSNVVLIEHALTGSSRVLEWWAGIAGEGALFDPSHWCAIGINALGSCYGSTGPASRAPDGRPYGERFPRLTVADIVRAERRVLSQLGIERIALAVGGSLGGMRALQWAFDAPERLGSAVAIGAHDHHSAMGIALNALQREALELDSARGLRLARKIATISYKSEELFNLRHDRRPDRNGKTRFDVEGYLEHQAERFEARMDPASYAALTHAMDSFDVRERVVEKPAPALVFVGISSDALFRAQDVRTAAERFSLHGWEARYCELSSSHGHDAFLAEPRALRALLEPIVLEMTSNGSRKSDGVAALGFSTRAVWSGQDACPATGATIVPVYQTATFTLPEIGIMKGFDYSRTRNPTRLALERQLAALENAEFARAFASGMAAVAAATSLLSSGDHVIATRDIYGGTHRFFTQTLARYGVEVTFVDTSDVRATWAAAKPATRLLWLETPSNPTLRLCDIEALSRLRPPGVLVAVDNTFASPFLQQPLQLGADLVVHSTTKYIGGHSDTIGGAVVTNDRAIADAIAFHQNSAGAVPGPWDAYLTIRGAKTLALRMSKHSQNAQAVGEFLSRRADVEVVYYPGLPAHPQHELAKRQMHGFGGIISFRAAGGIERARAIATKTAIFALAVSLGGVESLICNPATMTHGSLSPQERIELGITDDLLRLSVGIEDVNDLIADLASALGSTRVSAPRYSGILCQTG
ncbi:MAG: homoserine O-acetyltransferase [Candidatus Cybelea sp.]